MAALIAEAVKTALDADRANSNVPPILPIPSSTPVVSSSENPPCSGSVPVTLPSLSNSAATFSASGSSHGVQLGQGRPAQSFVVPSFKHTFATPSISPFVFSSANVCASQSGTTRDVADRSCAQLTPSLDQPFVVGPGFSPVPAKLVAQIVSGKYADLSELLAVNLQQKEPEPQLLLDGRLVLTSQPKKPRRRIEDITSWMEAFAIFSLILVSHFPPPVLPFVIRRRLNPTSTPKRQYRPRQP